MKAKVTDEYIYENDDDIRRAVDVEEKKKTHIKEVRVKAAKRRAIECLEDVRSLKQDGLDCGNVKQKLTKLKMERRDAKREYRRKT